MFQPHPGASLNAVIGGRYGAISQSPAGDPDDSVSSPLSADEQQREG